MSDELCNCGHRKSQHKAIVCSWWNCNCKQFEPLRADEPKRERKPVEEPPQAAPHAVDIIRADVAPQEVEQSQSPLRATQEVEQLQSQPRANQEVEQLRSRLQAAQEEIARLKQLQDGNHMLATRLGAENNDLRDALAEIKRLVEAILARP